MAISCNRGSAWGRTTGASRWRTACSYSLFILNPTIHSGSAGIRVNRRIPESMQPVDECGRRELSQHQVMYLTPPFSTGRPRHARWWLRWHGRRRCGPTSTRGESCPFRHAWLRQRRSLLKSTIGLLFADALEVGWMWVPCSWSQVGRRCQQSNTTDAHAGHPTWRASKPVSNYCRQGQRSVLRTVSHRERRRTTATMDCHSMVLSAAGVPVDEPPGHNLIWTVTASAQ